ncbi:MAG: YceD family protein [Thiobacillaceae bacterium]
MSARPVIHSLRFAETAGRMSGEYSLQELDRLHDVLASRDGALHWWLEGGHDAGRPVLRLGVEGRLTLVCQRCLGSCVLPLKLEAILPIARDEEELSRWENEDPLLDGLVAEPQLDVRDLIEDEVLLSLPAIPKHPIGACGRVDD